MTTHRGGDSIRFAKTAVVAGGHTAKALGFADKATQLIDGRCPDVGLRRGVQIGGASGVVHWTMDVEDLNTVATMFRALMTDGDHPSLVDSAGSAFVHGSTHDTMVCLVAGPARSHRPGPRRTQLGGRTPGGRERLVASWTTASTDRMHTDHPRTQLCAPGGGCEAPGRVPRILVG